MNLYSQKFNKANSYITSDSYGLLNNYNWPGNIYEMENIIERAIIESADGKITPNDLKINFPSNLSSLKDDIDLLFDIDLFLKKKIPLTELLEGIEELIIRNTIKESGQVQVRAAEILGITKSLLQYKMKKYNISV